MGKLLCSAIWWPARDDQTDSRLSRSDVIAIELFLRVNFVSVESFLPFFAAKAA